MNYTSDSLIAGVRRLGYLPDASDITDTDLLEFADEEQVTLISAAIKIEREEHYVTSVDFAFDGVTKSYQLPRRAMGRMVRGVIYVSPTGITYPCPEVDPVRGWFGRSASAVAYCHSISGDTINIPGPGPIGWTMRVFYLRRPSQLVPTIQAAQVITASDTVTLTVNSAALPIWLTARAHESPPYPIDSLYVDIVRGDAPFDLSYVDRLLWYYATNAVVLRSSTPINPADFVNTFTITNDRLDYVCLRDQTVYPAAPAEFFPALEAAVCRRALEAIGDRVGVEVVSDTYSKRLTAAVDITAPRDESGGRYIVRRGSPLRGGAMRGWGRGRRIWR